MIIKKFITITFILLLQITINSSYAVDPDEILQDKEQEIRARNISKNIRCMVCQNQSIDDSDAPLAKDLRILVRKKIKDGQKDSEIYDFLVDRYGDFILLKPALKVETFALWFLPIVFFIVAILVILKHNRKAKKI